MSVLVIEPLAAYDVRDGSYQHGGEFLAFDDWASANGIQIADTFRVEIYLVDCPFARVFQYDLGEGGRVPLDLATGDIAQRKPFDLPISSMPPVKPRPVS